MRAVDTYERKLGGEWAAISHAPSSPHGEGRTESAALSSHDPSGWHCHCPYFTGEELRQRPPRCGPWGPSLEPSPRVWERGSREKGTSVRRPGGFLEAGLRRGRGAGRKPPPGGAAAWAPTGLAPALPRVGKAVPSLSVAHITPRVAQAAPSPGCCAQHTVAQPSSAMVLIFDVTGTTLSAMESPQVL